MVIAMRYRRIQPRQFGFEFYLPPSSLCVD
jgi:hypothetical protein